MLVPQSLTSLPVTTLVPSSRLGLQSVDLAWEALGSGVCCGTAAVCLHMGPGCTTGAKPFPAGAAPAAQTLPGGGGPGPWALPAVPSRWPRSQTSLSTTDIVITEGLIKSWAKLKHARSERPLVSAVLK